MERQICKIKTTRYFIDIKKTSTEKYYIGNEGKILNSDVTKIYLIIKNNQSILLLIINIFSKFVVKDKLKERLRLDEELS